MNWLREQGMDLAGAGTPDLGSYKPGSESINFCMPLPATNGAPMTASAIAPVPGPAGSVMVAIGAVKLVPHVPAGIDTGATTIGGVRVKIQLTSVPYASSMVT